MNTEKSILIFGKLPPPFIGPAVATKIILNSKLKKHFCLIHFDLSHHQNITKLGKASVRNILTPFLQYFKLIWYIFRFKPAIIYMPSQQSTIGYLRDVPFILISKLFGKKVVLHLRGANFLNWYGNCNKIVKWVIRQTQNMIDAQIVLGNNLHLIFSPFMPEDKIYVVPNGANYNYSDISGINDKINIAFLGNYVLSKGIIDYIKSATMLSEEYNGHVNFLMSGHRMDATCDTEMNKLINSNKKIQFINKGPLIGKKKMEYLQKSDIFVYPTYNDGHPWVIIEAMAAGLPIISTDQGAIIESVLDRENGFIVEQNNPKQIAEKIQFLIDHPKIRIEMGNRSRELYLKNFTEETLVENFRNVFNAVLKKN